ncbi:MAG: class I SAM-dependent DNA methyltransferase, partial [Pyramidobacter sp.]|nr:class I SAM-dependent DNA methyltransferase [Pyramidobacter sp.]
MKDNEQKKAAKKFAEYWKDRGYEKGESQPFWLSLLRSVFGVEEPEKFIQFENPVLIQHMSFIDAYIPASRVMIEQKGRDKDLRKGIKQSDGSFLTPFQQAQRYIPNLPVDLHPRYIITCNFQTFLIYDMQHPLAEPAEIKLADLEKEYYRLKFIVEGAEKAHIKREEELSIKAGEIVGKLYSALEKQYADVLSKGDTAKLSAEVRSWLNKLCVRLVFCFYAEDAGVFGKKNMFHDYLAGFHVQNVRDALIKLFTILDTQEKDRDPFDTSPASAFPYVNGGLFSNCSSKEVPPLTEAIVTIILNDCCDQFDWSEISPTIFGAVFESTLNQETRRSGGMHYTSIENIHKVIDPLFLDDLKREYAELCEIKLRKNRRAALAAFQDKLASLHFLDPAAGSGNFLTESYLCLRKIENDLLRRLVTDDEGEGILLADIKVNISQFYGIEINDFAVSVAKTALWIAESQMMNVTESIIGATRDFLPLKTNANIVEGNALRLDWKEIVPPEKLNYIMGNPPFVGMAWMSKEQKNEIIELFPQNKKAGTLDYVSGWYIKALRFIAGTKITVAFVSTNSICQGEQIAALWKYLADTVGYEILFAHTTFRWDSEASLKAHVHCVIVGFCANHRDVAKKLYSDKGIVRYCNNISPYLTEGKTIYIERRTKPICDVPSIHRGNQPTDGGNLIIEKDEYDDFVKKEP